MTEQEPVPVTQALLPCPFCGSSDVGLLEADAFSVACLNCGCRTGKAWSLIDGKQRAIAAWNTRATIEEGKRLAAKDADNTPHAFDWAAPDTCRKCGNGKEHTVHAAQQPVLPLSWAELGYWGPDVDGDFLVTVLGRELSFAVPNETKAKRIVAAIEEGKRLAAKDG